ncbi:MAG TPA: hypothetical protein VF228_21660, partial [Iamia sp.]
MSPVDTSPTVTGPRPAWVGLAVTVAAIAFVALRLLAHDGDATLFVRAGDELTDPARGEAAGLTVAEDSAGYDGQYSYRLARAPLSGADRVDGVGLDRPVDRVSRIGYPALAWVGSLGGQRGLVPWSLIGVNVLALGAIGALAASLARDAGRSSWWGLVPAAAPGLLVALSRDLTEVVAAAALLGGLVLLRRGRFGPAAAVLLFAAVSRETTLVLPAAVVAAALLPHLPALPASLERARRALVGDRPSVPLWVGLAPLAGYAAWRTWLSVAWDAPRSFGDPGATVNGVTVPFVRPLTQAVRFLTGGDPVDQVQLLQLVLVGLAVALVAWAAWRAEGVGAPERL